MRIRHSRFVIYWLAALFISGCLLNAQSLSPADIMEKYGKAVVLIAGIKNGEEVGLGSGFIVKSEGVIITNHHVIEGAYPAIVKTRDGDIYDDISVIDFDERRDIAIIKIKGFDLPTVNLGNSNNVKVGERVVIIGNPEGYENTISDGLLSQIRDSGEGYTLHQVSAPISHGSSGSPVFNQKGEVIGIATLMATEGQNLNFSVPINYARGMIDGTVRYPLKEFAGLAKETSFTGVTKRTEGGDSATILEKINIHVIELYNASENIFMGCMLSSNSAISPLIGGGNQSLIILSQDLPKLYCPDNLLCSLKDTLLAATSLALQSSNNIVNAIVRPDPNWQRASSELAAMTTAINQKINREFIVNFVKRVREDNPKLESSIIPAFLEVFENKDKSPDEIEAEQRTWGHLRINWRNSTRIPTIMWVQKNGPADRAGIKAGDVILGVFVGSVLKTFRTVMDLSSFQKTTKPGQTYTYKLSRNGKTYNATVKLQ